MERCSEVIKCETCNHPLQRDFRAEQGVQTRGNWPQESDAAGVGAGQVEEATKESVELGVPTNFTEDGSAIITSRSHRKKYCEAIGLFDRDGGYSDPSRK